MSAVHRNPQIVPNATGYVASCDECSFSKEYASKASARGGLAAHRCRSTSTEDLAGAADGDAGKRTQPGQASASSFTSA